jgi:hypothetical protein
LKQSYSWSACSLYYWQQSVAPTPSDLSGWLKALAGGVTDEQVIVAFVSSDEYFLNQGHQFAPWLGQVYLDVLGRPRGSDETGFLNALVQGTLTRAQVIALITGSGEYRLNLISSYFSRFLGRPPSSTDMSTWLGNLGSGFTDEQFAATLAGSAEYIGRSHCLLD